VIGGIVAHNQLSGSPTDRASYNWFTDSSSVAYENRVARALDSWGKNAQSSEKLPIARAVDQLIQIGGQICTKVGDDMSIDPPSMPPTEPLRSEWSHWTGAVDGFVASCRQLMQTTDPSSFSAIANKVVTAFIRANNSEDALVATQGNIAKRLGLHDCGTAYCSG
jgi:hypothetical protein